jgi:DNA-binding MarR family transcriptional regulator
MRNCQWRFALAADLATAKPTLELAQFLPFRLNRLAEAVSRNLSEIYQERFGLEIPEWRVLVTVGQREECTAQHIALSTRMHKTRVSRAVASLEQRRLIVRASGSRDGREMHLQLTKAGNRMYAELVPLALAREEVLLSCLTRAEQRTFATMLSRMELSLGLSGDE